MSTRSNATTRRIESGPAPNSRSRVDGEESDVFEDWTLSLPVLRKPKSNVTVDASVTISEPPPEALARKCKSFTDWTMSLSDPYERDQKRLREMEREHDRERKTSHVSMASATSARHSQRSITARLPIGPRTTSSSPQNQSHPLSNTSSTTSLNRAASKSTASIHSISSYSSTASSSSSSVSSYKDMLPFDPCSPDVAPVSPLAPSFSNASTYADSLLIIPPAPRPPSAASTSVSTLANFPIPPSFSSKLLQRRAAVPPLPRPLRPTGAYHPHPNGSGSGGRRSFTSSSPRTRGALSSSIYVEPSRASTYTALPTIPNILSSSHLSATDLDAHVAIATSAPATSLNFPSSCFNNPPPLGLSRRSLSLRRRRESGGATTRLSLQLPLQVDPKDLKDALDEEGRPDSYYLNNSVNNNNNNSANRPTTSSSMDSVGSDVSTTSTVSAGSTISGGSVVGVGMGMSMGARRSSACSVKSNSSTSTVVPATTSRTRIGTPRLVVSPVTSEHHHDTRFEQQQQPRRSSGSFDSNYNYNHIYDSYPYSYPSRRSTETTGTVRSSFESSAYDMCNEDGFDEDFIISTSSPSRSRSSLSLSHATSFSPTRRRFMERRRSVALTEETEEDDELDEEECLECFYSARSSLNL